MKISILLIIYLGVAFSGAQYLYQNEHNNIKYDGRYGYASPQIGPDGVPIDTPEVQHARAAHLAAVQRAREAHAAWASNDGSYGGQCGNSNSYDHSHSHDNAYDNHYGYPHSSGGHQQSPYPVSHENIKYDGRYGYANLQIGPDGVPIDTPEVQHAKAAHLAAVSKAKALHAGWTDNNGLYGGQHGSSNLYGQGNQYGNSNLYGKGNQHGNSNLYGQGNQQGNSNLYGQGNQHGSSSLHGQDNQHELRYDGRYGYGYYGQDGVPVDTPEVQHAKAVQLTAQSHTQESHNDWTPQENNHYRHRRSVKNEQAGHAEIDLHKPNINPEAFIYPEFDHDGNPIDTPAVRALKQAHFAAHAAALARIEHERKINGWKEGQIDDGSWKDDTLWNDNGLWTNNAGNNNDKKNNNIEHNEGVWNNHGYDSNAWKIKEPSHASTFYNDQQLELGPHRKITWKNDEWVKNRGNRRSWKNEDHDTHAWKNIDPIIPFNKIEINQPDQHHQIGWRNDPWINEGDSNNALNNVSHRNNAWKHIEPTILHNNQNLEFGLQNTKIQNTKIAWKNNIWNNIDNNSWHNTGSIPPPRKHKFYDGPTHIPKILNGVPEDTPEVRQAREQHLAALAAATARAAAHAAAYKKTHQEHHQ